MGLADNQCNAQSAPQRSIPSMGTPHALLRRAQSENKDQNYQMLSTSTVPDHLFKPLSTTGSNSDQPVSPKPQETNTTHGVRQIYLDRSTDFQGYGFHVDSHNDRHVIYFVEANSPAERAGLRVNDQILQVNEHSTKNIPTSTFIQLIKRSQGVHLLVQNVSDMSSTETRPKEQSSLRKFPLFRTLSRLTSRSSQGTG